MSHEERVDAIMHEYCTSTLGSDHRLNFDPYKLCEQALHSPWDFRLKLRELSSERIRLNRELIRINRERRVDAERVRAHAHAQQVNERERQLQQGRVAAAAANVAMATAQLASAIAAPPPPPPPVTPSRLQKVNWQPRALGAMCSYEDEFETTAATVSLCDPISLTRIETPVRFRTCTHFQCFDVDTHFQCQTHPPTTHSRCPVCNISAPTASLVIDTWFQSLLRTVPADHKFVEVDTNTGDTIRSFSERAARKRKAPGADRAPTDTMAMDLCDDDAKDANDDTPIGSSTAPICVD
jgi:hypothetical protein